MPQKKGFIQNLTNEDVETNKHFCYVSEEIKGEILRAYVRADVCNNLPAEFEGEDGNYYCVLHYPSDEKILTTNFDSFFRERLEKNYRNFQYTYFPNVGIFSGRTILNDVNLAHSTFSGEAYFNSSKFKGRLIFNNARFKESAHFGSSIFEQEINFENTIFEKGANFNSAAFNGSISFSKSLFEGKAEFREATFNEIVFFDATCFDKTVDFTCASFNFSEFTKTIFNGEVYFTSVKFDEQADFSFSAFSSFAYITSATFLKNVFFNFSKFNENARIYFIQTNFNGAISFVKADIDGYLHFEGGKRESMKSGSIIQEGITFSFIGNDSLMILEHARIKNPEKMVFHSVRLQPNWFINQEGTKKIVFTNCDWKSPDENDISFTSEIFALQNREILNPDRLLKITYRQLAENAESNNRFEEASKFRQLAFECERFERKERIEKWFQESISCSSLLGKIGEKAKIFPYDFVHWLYRWTSGYGENRVWAFFVLSIIIIISAILYATPLCEFPNGQNGVRSLDFIESIAYSLRVMVLQRPEPFPVNNFGKVVLALESVFAPLQLALLALAIRRKFMR